MYCRVNTGAHDHLVRTDTTTGERAYPVPLQRTTPTTVAVHGTFAVRHHIMLSPYTITADPTSTINTINATPAVTVTAFTNTRPIRRRRLQRTYR